MKLQATAEKTAFSRILITLLSALLSALLQLNVPSTSTDTANV